MSTAAIVVIGNEILSAKITDENGPWLLRELPGSAEEKWRGVFLVMGSAWFLAALAWIGVDASKPLFQDRPSESTH